MLQEQLIGNPGVHLDAGLAVCRSRILAMVVTSFGGVSGIGLLARAPVRCPDGV
jgi:hypothetical protein